MRSGASGSAASWTLRISLACFLNRSRLRRDAGRCFTAISFYSESAVSRLKEDRVFGNASYFGQAWPAPRAGCALCAETDGNATPPAKSMVAETRRRLRLGTGPRLGQGRVAEGRGGVRRAEDFAPPPRPTIKREGETLRNESPAGRPRKASCSTALG